MRFSELRGLPITALYPGDVETGPLRDELAKCGLAYGRDYWGYILLESQPFHDDGRREPDGTVLRKPLKGRKRIEPRHARVIPIFSKEVRNVLALRLKQQQALLFQKKYGADRSNYLLFDDCEWNRTTGALRQAYEALGQPPKGYHCCRHSFVTFLVGRTRSFFLVRALTGHKKAEAFERYLHTFEQIARLAKQEEQAFDVI
jgi:integrase